MKTADALRGKFPFAARATKMFGIEIGRNGNSTTWYLCITRGIQYVTAGDYDFRDDVERAARRNGSQVARCISFWYKVSQQPWERGVKF